MERIVIPVNRTKMTIALVSAFILFAYGCYLAFYVANDPTSHFSPLAMSIVGFILIGIFGFALGIGLMRFFTLKDALILTDEGFECPILDPNLGVIPWDAVYKVELDSVMAINKALFIYVNDAQDFIDKSNGWKKRTLKNQYKAYGTPFTLMTVNLKANKPELDRMVRERWKARKAQIEAAESTTDENA